MSDALSRLLKVLDLERKQGYRNKAVIGGLDKFASRWEADARPETPNPAVVNEIVALLLGYPAVADTAARERIVEQIIHRAGEMAATPRTAGDMPEEGESWREGAKGPGLHSADSAAADQGPVAPQTPPVPAHAASSPVLPSQPAEYREPTPGRGMPAPSKPDQKGPQGDERPLRTTPPEARPVLLDRPPAQPTIAPAGPEKSETPSREPEQPAAGISHVVSRPLPSPPPVSSAPGSGLDAPVTRLPGVGPSLAEKLAKLKVVTVRDLLYLLPHRYEDYSALRTIDRLRHGEEVTIIGTVWDIKARIISDDRKMITAVVGDGSGELIITWFNPYVERRLRSGRAYSFSGRIESYRDRLVMRNPEFEPLEAQQINTGRLVPIYPLTEGISDRWLRRVMRNAVDAWTADMPDPLPPEVRQDARLIPLGNALSQIHFPDSQEQLAAAHRRLSFDEFLTLQLAVLGHRRRFRELTARPLRADDSVLAPFLDALSFPLTGAQQRALADIVADLGSAQPMSRLLQGDVGSGKTAVAAAALWVAVVNETQGAIMAPTEILAEQHARSFGGLFASLTVPDGSRPVRVALFTSTALARRTEREAALAALAAGEIDIAVGTHALIQQGVTFRELTVAVVDEQHRFGVEQRSAFRQKGSPVPVGSNGEAGENGTSAAEQPHMLVMSATPIPRSLALTIYGDLDVSVIDEMPPGRIPIKTRWLTSHQRERAYSFIRRQIESGRQAFIIYPLVAEGSLQREGEQGEAKAAVEEHARLSRAVFPDLRVGLLHGRLRGEAKDHVMRAFSTGELDLLVATSVVEVGIDVPNATVMLIESADRFGLAQLHQFRGRVGRGEHPSYCILISDANESGSVKRLQALEDSTDGFALAQVDMEMRGPGDFFGTRQSGLPPLRTAQLGDLPTLEAARAAAQKLFAADPSLNRPEHRELAAQVATFWASAGDIS